MACSESSLSKQSDISLSFECEGFSARYEIISENVLYLASSGYFGPQHVGALVAIREEIYRKRLVIPDRHFLMADYTHMTGAGWMAGYALARSLRALDKELRCEPKLIAAWGATGIFYVQLWLGNGLFMKNFRLVKNRARALQIIEREARRIGASLK